MTARRPREPIYHIVFEGAWLGKKLRSTLWYEVLRVPGYDDTGFPGQLINICVDLKVIAHG